MTGSSHSALAGEPAAPGTWGRGDRVLLILAVVTLVLIAVQFALAGFGAFTMDKTPTDNAYGAHMVLGVVIGVMTWLILATVLASRTARTHPRTLRLAIAVALLALPVEALLGDTGQHIPALGALHALNGLAIFALTGWLTGETVRRRAAAREPGRSVASAPPERTGRL